MKYKSLIIFILIISCRISYADPNIDIFHDIYKQAREEVNYVKQNNDEWKTHSEIDLNDVDCDGIALWMGGEAIDRGVDPSVFWYGIFKHKNEEGHHMAILYDTDDIEITVIPSSGLQVLDPFIPLNDYLTITDMSLEESFQFVWE